MLRLDDLDGYRVHQALRCCIDIYNDYDESELESLPPSVYHAWQTGRLICDDLDKLRENDR